MNTNDKKRVEGIRAVLGDLEKLQTIFGEPPPDHGAPYRADLNFLLAQLDKAHEALRDTDRMVSRFLAWKLPATVCSDPCVTTSDYPHRLGTNLLTATEAKEMIDYLLQEAREALGE
jgi:hypothetical protein